ncbi:APC membrane recruitment protein 2 [Pantherophis guttatus]|uniref:APC membrane recruitment protein 2 n=1 Tax=Pantherophis guttatus TaxID=94885 RepID=A0A6P9B9J7_PANGU|nr:APC membrane recruitment protein 2 [Pantherophis guttatus]
MDAHCDGGEPTALGEQPPPPPPPSGKLNKTAFKLFKRRKSGGAMPSIFGVRSSGKSKSGEGGGGGGQGTGMVRSKTHDGLAEVLELESGKNEGPGTVESGRVADSGGASVAAKEAASSCSSSAAAAAGKSHSFFSLLRKNGRSDEGGKGERAKGRGGLKGLFSSMRWSRREKPGGGVKDDEAGESSEGQASPSILNTGSLTASLECIKEEAPPPGAPTDTVRTPLVTKDGEQPTSPLATEVMPTPDLAPQPAPCGSGGEELPGILPQEKEIHPESTSSDGQEIKEDSAKTGCGDIIADQEDDVGSGGGSGGGGSERSAPGIGKAGPSKKPTGVVTYQGGGEEMASPEQVGGTQEFWDLLSHTEEKSQGTSGRKESPETSKGDKIVRRVQDGSANGKHIGLSQIPVHHQKEDQKNREKEQQEAIPSSDEGYWDSTTPGPEEDNTNSIQKEVIPRDSYSGDALYDLYTDPDENTATVTSAENITTVTCCKPLSPITTTCPVKTHTTSLKDSKIPISIKHFTSPHSSHGQDSSNSHHIVHHQATKSEIPRTKIPVSKVLVHRASYRSLAGTTGKTATYHESAKK